MFLSIIYQLVEAARRGRRETMRALIDQGAELEFRVEVREMKMLNLHAIVLI